MIIFYEDEIENTFGYFFLLMQMDKKLKTTPD